MSIQIVLKFGGTSVGSADSIYRVLKIVERERDKNPLVVVSALSRITDSLVQLADICLRGNSPRVLTEAIFNRHYHVARSLGIRSLDPIRSIQAAFEKHLSIEIKDAAWKDALLAYGEELSATIIHQFFNEHGLYSTLLDSRALIVTDNTFGQAVVKTTETSAKIVNALGGKSGVFIAAGFIARNESGQTTTLGRGGSDYSAAIFGSALKVKEIQIWSDVDGICSADPNIDKKAKSFSQLTYKEALDLALAGAKVLHPKTIGPAEASAIPLRVKNTFNPLHPGTTIEAVSRQSHQSFESKAV